MEKMKKNKYAWVAFGGPFLFMIFILLMTKCAPFGKNSLMIVDAIHQYLPFFADYQEKLKNVDSLFYSWHGGLGYNFYSLWAYYLSSPMNLIVSFVPKMALIPVLNLIIAIKFSLCSLTGFFYFSHREGRQSFRNVAFGLCYSFSSYMTGYYWNVMWLEVMILLPIILIGMDKLMDHKNGKMYCLALFASMLCNYYMTFMVCIFLVLWYFTYYFTGIKEIFHKGILFAWNSLLAAAMAAVVLLPAYMGLMDTSSATLNFPEWTPYGKTAELFATHMAGAAPYTMSVEDGLGNLYCGILPLILLVLYLIDKKFPWEEKLRKICILALLAVSFQVEILNYIWHGFHNQYGIPNRFAFLYIFLILIMAYDQITYMDIIGTKRWKIIFAMAVLLAGIGYCYQQNIYDEKIPYLVSAGLVVGYAILLCIRTKWVKQIICIFMIVEVLGNAVFAFSSDGQVDGDYYFSETDGIQKIKEKQNPSMEQRMDLLESKMLDESIWHTIPNATMFGSTALGKTVDAMDQLGFYTGVNEYLYEGGTLVTDMLLGMKSILVRNGDAIYRTGYEYMYSKDEVSLYTNSLNTAIGYWMNAEAGDGDYSSQNPFEVQNNLMKHAYGCEELYDAIDVDEPIANDCDITDQGDGSYYVENKTSQLDNVTFVFNVEKNMDMYLHFDCGAAENSEIFVNGYSQDSGRLNAQIVSVGQVNEGDTVSVQIQLKDGTEGDGMITMRAVSLNQSHFRQLIDKMEDHRFELESYTSTKIQGRIQAKEDGILFFSIPYDKGWKIMIDGEEVNSRSMIDGFLATNIKSGDHQIQLSYCPPGFSLGWKISLIGWFLFCFPWILEQSKKRFRKNSHIEVVDMI